MALKSRSIEPKLAVEQSLAALDWLKSQGCTQFFFKYCSTFDSTPAGNIGPVADALAEALNAHKVIICPAFPGTGRSIYQGHLFVADTLLNESGMQNHPLTPMIDADIRRLLAPQSRFSIGHVAAQDVSGGVKQIVRALQAEHDAGKRHIVVDAIQDADLMEIGAAAKDLRLITGGSGVALGLPRNFGCTPGDFSWQGQAGPAIALSGSCSIATRAQVAQHKKTNPTFEINATDVIEGRLNAKTVADWLMEQDGLPLAYSSANPEAVEIVQAKFGLAHSTHALEQLFADVANICVTGGVTRIITAGGETSGAVVKGLKLSSLEIGPEIDPGVPCLRARPDLVVALKSGNFGAKNFFAKANRMLEG